MSCREFAEFDRDVVGRPATFGEAHGHIARLPGVHKASTCEGTVLRQPVPQPGWHGCGRKNSTPSQAEMVEFLIAQGTPALET